MLDSNTDSSDSLDYTDSIIPIEDDSERNDVMGDIVDPMNLTLDDFLNEHVWKDSGITKIHWFMKPEKEENHRIAKGWHKNEVRSDAIEDNLHTQAELEVAIIDSLGPTFYKRISKLAETGLEGNPELAVWFTTEDGTPIERRSEVLEFVELCESWRLENIEMKYLYAIQNGLYDIRVEAFKMFNNSFVKEEAKTKFKAISRIIFNHAVKEKTGDAEGTQISLENGIREVRGYLNVSMLSNTVKTYCMRLYWALIKCHIEPQMRAKLIKWATLVSISKSRENATNEKTIDNYFGLA